MTGRVAVHQGRPAIWNPRYQLDPRGRVPAATRNGNRQWRRLRVYLGMAAGVGKTYAMLE